MAGVKGASVQSQSQSSESGNGLLSRFPLLKHWQQRWQALAGREQALLAIVAALAVVSVLWWLLLKPAIANWKNAQQGQAKWESKMQRIQKVGKKAEALRAMKSLSTDDAKVALTESMEMLNGAGQVVWQAGSARVTLQNAQPKLLAQWLSAARLNALSVPTSSSLTLGEQGWTGTVVLRLPAEE